MRAGIGFLAWKLGFESLVGGIYICDLFFSSTSVLPPAWKQSVLRPQPPTSHYQGPCWPVPRLLSVYLSACSRQLLGGPGGGWANSGNGRPWPLPGEDGVSLHPAFVLITGGTLYRLNLWIFSPPHSQALHNRASGGGWEPSQFLLEVLFYQPVIKRPNFKL